MILREPTALIGASGRHYGIAAARGPEPISFGGVGASEQRQGVLIKGNTFNVREEADITKVARALDRIAERRAVLGYGRRR
jgi:hypothetical protein